MQGRPWQPNRSYGSDYGSLLNHDEPALSSSSNRRDVRGSSQDERDSSCVGGVSSVMRRTLGAISVLFLFGMGASMGNSRQHAGKDVGVSTGYAGVILKEKSASPFVATVTTPALTVRAFNEYGQYDRVGLKMYGFEMVVEPFRETTLKAADLSRAGDSRPATYNWGVRIASSAGEVDPNVPPVANGVGGPEFTVTLTRPGSLYILDVEKQDEDGTVVASSRVTITCKYVRRELRDLTQADRDAFLDALQEFYSLTKAQGIAKYGPDFFNYEVVTAFHSVNPQQFCYHGGMQFLSAHTAFDLMVERSLQMINPKVSLASWDFMIDEHNFGVNWTQSPIFGDDMFGSAINFPEDSFQLSDGRFRNVSTIHDPDHVLVDSRMSAGHNAYGYISAVYNYQDLPRLTRTSSYCGLRARVKFASSDIFIGCFEDNTNLKDWQECMEGQVHGDMHGLLGGSFNCNVDFKSFYEKNKSKYSPGLLTFLLSYVTTTLWPDNAVTPGYNTCDTSCERGDTDCGCTCNVDAMSMTADEVYDFSTGFLARASEKFNGGSYISYKENACYPWGLQQDGDRLSDGDTIFLLRHLLKVGCEPGSFGFMTGGASPLDPIFWVLHPMFEKALHILWLSPRYKNTYSFEWVGSDCFGSEWDDELPFTEKALGFGDGTDFLTNARIMSDLHPSNPEMTYIYDKIGEWGGSTAWQPCPECSAAIMEEDMLL